MELTLLTANDVAKELRIKKYTVYELIKRGELPSSRVGKQLRVSRQDIERYLRGSRTGPGGGPLPPDAVPLGLPPMASLPALGVAVISGQDRCVDLLAARAEGAGERTLRSCAGCHDSLIALYHGKVTMAASHLWDAATGEYNGPFIQRLLPGVPAGALRLAGRMQGLYVRKGNPLGICGWEDFARNGLRMINRERGSGTRALLDQKLRLLGIDTERILGYDREASHHVACAGAVARGDADVGCGCEAAAQSISAVDFVPLQLEWYDLVFPLSARLVPAVRIILDYVQSGDFKRDLETIGSYEVSQTGLLRRY